MPHADRGSELGRWLRRGEGLRHLHARFSLSRLYPPPCSGSSSRWRTAAEQHGHRRSGAGRCPEAAGVDLGTAKGRVRVGISSGSQVRLGGLFSFNINSEVAGRLVLLDVNASGEVVQIFPNRHVVSGDAKFVDKGKSVSIPDPTNPTYRGLTGFRAVEPLGRGRLIAIVAPRDAPIADIVEEPQRMTKGFAPEGAPASYLMNLFDQLIAAASAPERMHSSGRWERRATRSSDD